MKTACQKLFPVTRSMFLQFSKSTHLHSARLRKCCRKAQAVLLTKFTRQPPLFLLCSVAYLYRAAHTAAALMGTPSSCSFHHAHHAHRMRLSCLLETHCHSDVYGWSSSTALEPLMTLSRCYVLPLLPSRRFRTAAGGRESRRSAKCGHIIAHTLYGGAKLIVGCTSLGGVPDGSVGRNIFRPARAVFPGPESSRSVGNSGRRSPRL